LINIMAERALGSATSGTNGMADAWGGGQLIATRTAISGESMG